MNIKAILLAAGNGTRLNCEAANKPKCLFTIGNETMLDHWLNKLNAVGVNEFLINTHFLEDQVIDFINGHKLKRNISLFHESSLLGTAETLRRNLYFFSDSTFVVHVDNYCHDNLVGFMNAHAERPKQCIMSMLTFRSNHPSNCGIVVTDDHFIMTDFFEKYKNPPGNIANGAVYIMSSEMADFIKNQPGEDISINLLPNLKNKILCFQTKRFFIDMGTPTNLTLARNKISHNSTLSY